MNVATTEALSPECSEQSCGSLGCPPGLSEERSQSSNTTGPSTMSPLDLAGFVPEPLQAAQKIWDDSSPTSLPDLQLSGGEFATEDSYMVVMLVHVKHAKSIGETAPLRMTGQNYSKRGKLGPSPYRRLLFFFDLLGKGDLLAMFEKGIDDEKRIWGNPSHRAPVRVGSCFVILEPTNEKTITSGSAAVVQTKFPLIAIKMPDLRTFIPAWDQPQLMTGFCQKEVELAVRGYGPVASQCTGSFCDRLYPSKKFCGCYMNDYRNVGSAVTYEGIFCLTLNGERHQVKASSLAFFESLVRGLVPPTLRLDELRQEGPVKRVRKALSRILTHVNALGGWTVVGWHRQGESHDADDDKVLSEHIGAHIVKIFPSNQELLDSEEFNDFMLDVKDLKDGGMSVAPLDEQQGEAGEDESEEDQPEVNGGRGNQEEDQQNHQRSGTTRQGRRGRRR